jgi:hypothetical protein
VPESVAYQRAARAVVELRERERDVLEREPARPSQNRVRCGAEPAAERARDRHGQEADGGGNPPEYARQHGVPRSARRAPEPAPQRAPGALVGATAMRAS